MPAIQYSKPRIVLADGEVLEDVEFGYTEIYNQLWIDFHGRTMADVIARVMDPAKTDRIEGYLLNTRFLYEHFTIPVNIDLSPNQEYVSVRLLGAEGASHSSERIQPENSPEKETGNDEPAET